MDNQHRKISGYRELNQEEIDFMNRIKAFGPELEKLCDDLSEYHENQLDRAEKIAVQDRISDYYDALMVSSPHYWRHEGMRQLQQGLMFLTRSVAQPTFF